MKKRIRTYSGTASDAVTQRELDGRKIAREAAAEGMVLLKNEELLPLSSGTKVALFGGGAVRTVKGGTGSGDVNERETVSIWQGFRDAGLVITNEGWLEDYDRTYQQARERWREELLEGYRHSDARNFFLYYSSHAFRIPAGAPMKEQDLEDAQVAFYVISRTAGENADRFCEPGDYLLTEDEQAQLRFLSDHCDRLAVILNTGGPIDLKFIEALPNLKALLLISQPGMEGGHAAADVITGQVTPSGRLTDTWARNYEDYPNAGTFSHNNGDVQYEPYTEGQYVGYRFFDSFEREPAYPFGFGLSYTEFDMKLYRAAVSGNTVRVEVTVTNRGTDRSGREVVQIYLSCPQTRIPKVSKKLVAFAKTKLLAPGESQRLTLSFGAKDAASYDESCSAWIVEEGKYALWLGKSAAEVSLAALLEVEDTVVIEQDAPICPLTEPLTELVSPLRIEQEDAWQVLAARKRVQTLAFAPNAEQHHRASNPVSELAAQITEQLTEDQMLAMVIGEITKGQNSSELGSAGIMVPGAAGETSGALEETFGIPGVPMADGPAGLRLIKSYEVDLTDGKIINRGMTGALEGGFFCDRTDHDHARRYYQYATAIPVGTLLAQSWDEALLVRVGQAIAREMQEFGIAWWLAPGMNIHRNPLCGRNFEYYSEDPLLSGKMAAAITRGVQSVPGVGTTVKHFACNNQEDNRYGSNSVLSERVLREIYLRGFEIAVREAQPMCIMTSYNLINGVHTANSYDLCTQAARKEWDFRGIFMTDWTTTFPGRGSSPWKCIRAGNDLIMPGIGSDIEDIREALHNGKLSREELKACVRRILTVIMQTLVFEDVPAYGAQFEA